MTTFSLYPSNLPTFDPTKQNITANSTPAMFPVATQPVSSGYVPGRTLVPTTSTTPYGPASPIVPQPVAPYSAPSGSVASIAQPQVVAPASAPQTQVQPTPTPGSINGIVSGLGYSTADQAYLDTINAQDKANSLAAYDPNKAYSDALAQRQAQIDSINALYNDQLNQSRIQNAPGYQANLDQSRLQQGLGGYASSAAGTAQTQGTQDSNARTQEGYEANINAQRNTALASVFDKIDNSVTSAKTAFETKKATSTADYVAAIKNRPAAQAQLVSQAVKSILATGIDFATLSPEELKTLTDKLGVSPETLKAEYNTQKSSIDAANVKAAQDQAKFETDMAKTKAEIENLKGVEKQKALDRALEQQKIDVSWYNAKTSRTSAETTAKNADSNSKDAIKNYDSKTIPVEVKGSLFEDLTSNANASKKEKKSLNDFIASYPEIDTDYLTQLYEANK